MQPSEPRKTFDVQAADLPDAAALMRRDLGATFVNEGYLAWWYFSNPSGCFSFRAIREAGRIAALSTMNGFDFLFESGRRRVAMPQNVVVDAGLRGSGLFGKLYRDCEAQMRMAGVDCFLTFTNAASTPIFLSKFGYARGNVQDILLLPVMPWDFIPSRGCRQVSEFDEKTLARVPGGTLNAVIKDPRHVQWRYGALQGNIYRILELRSDGGSSGGYAVLKFVRKKGFPLALLLDLRLTGDVPVEEVLLRVRGFVARSGSLALTMFDDSCAGAAARGLLHVTVRERFNFLVKGRDAQETAALTKLRFNFSLGDLDFM